MSNSSPVHKKRWSFESDLEPLMIIYAVHERDNIAATFAHALKIAYDSKANLEIIDVRKKGMHQEVQVRQMLEKWGLLPKNSRREDVINAGLHIKKIARRGDTRKEIGKRLMRHRRDIMVIGTESRSGLPNLFGNELVKFLSDTFRQTTLFVPANAKPFVSERTGEFALKKVLVPVAESPSPEPSFEMLQRFMRILPQQRLEVVGVHYGQAFPFISASSLEGFSWKEVLRNEPFSASAVVKMAAQENIDLVVMSTSGRDTFSKKIIGSTTEQVLRHIGCPVLAVAV